jgi:hypothetical protein
MSKKLIAVASAAALALTALVGIAPAHATPTVAYLGEKTGTTGTSADPYILAMASSNTIATGASASPATATALRVLVGSIAAGDTVKLTATGALRVIDTAVTSANALIDVSKVGSQAYSKTLTSGTEVALFVYTTSTTAGSFKLEVTKTASGTTSTTTSEKFVNATVGLAYKHINATAPATLASAATGEVTFNVTDAFGNVLESNAGPTAVTLSTGTTVAATWDANRKLNYATITSPSSSAFTVSVDSNGSDVVGLGSHSSPVVLVVNGTGVAAQIAALTAQVTALTADYNAIAKKWNARVASKTAPKKKVALK